MDAVQRIEANKIRTEAERKIKEVVALVAAAFECNSEWVKVWVPQFRDRMVGSGPRPHFTAEQIGEGYMRMMQTYKWQKPPKPAHLAEAALHFVPPPQAQKKPEPLPRRSYTPAEREANKIKHANMLAFLESQEPEYRAILKEFGYGSPELVEVCARHKAELAAWIEQQRDIS